MYIVQFTPNFNKSYKFLRKGNDTIRKRVEKAISLLEEDPFYPSLKTHKVTTKDYGEKYSSRVTGDIRIIWDYDEDEQLILILLDVGSHSGKNKVYK